MRIPSPLKVGAWAVAAAVVAAQAAGPALAAAPPPPGQREDRGEEARKALERAGHEVKKGAEAAGREISKAFREVRDKLRTTREERRQKEVKEVRDRWGDLLGNPLAIEELRIHARRTARLRYIETLSDDLDMDSIQSRAKQAMKKEDDRFDERMKLIRSGGGAR